MKERETVMREMDSAQLAQESVDAMRIHYNFKRPNHTMGGQTPAEAGQVLMDLGENKVELMRQSAISRQSRWNHFHLNSVLG
jgi:hypothetical protein